MSSQKKTTEEIPESYQEYIVAIYRLSAQLDRVTNKDISEFMEIAPPSVYNMLKKLANRGLIDWQPKSKEIKLTLKGREFGKKIILGHLIMELFLREYLGLTDDKEIHSLACKMEHHITDIVKDGFRKKIGEEEYKKIEKIVDHESDPEEAIKKIHEVFPTPQVVINQFSAKLIEILPNSKKLIISAKEKFMNEF